MSTGTVKEKRCIIGDLIEELGTTQTVVAKGSGVPQAAISRYSKGVLANYNIPFLFALAEYFSTQIERINYVDDLFVDME